MILQPNLRSGETVLANPYGQTSNDYYLRYINNKDETSTQENISLDNIKNIILTEAKEILAAASQPIPKALLEPGLIKKLFSFGYSLQVTSDLIDKVLFEKIDETFKVDGDKKYEFIWSLINFEYEHIPIDERTETVIHDLVVRENIVTFDQIYEVVFSTFTDNLTPPYRDLVRIISKFAEKFIRDQIKVNGNLKLI